MNKYEQYLFEKFRYKGSIRVKRPWHASNKFDASWQEKTRDLREIRRNAPQEIEEPYVFTLLRQLPDSERYCQIFDRAIALWFDGPPCFIDALYWRGVYKLSVGFASYHKDGSDIPF